MVRDEEGKCVKIVDIIPRSNKKVVNTESSTVNNTIQRQGELKSK